MVNLIQISMLGLGILNLTVAVNNKNYHAIFAWVIVILEAIVIIINNR